MSRQEFKYLYNKIMEDNKTGGTGTYSQYSACSASLGAYHRPQLQQYSYQYRSIILLMVHCIRIVWYYYISLLYKKNNKRDLLIIALIIRVYFGVLYEYSVRTRIRVEESAICYVLVRPGVYFFGCLILLSVSCTCIRQPAMVGLCDTRSTSGIALWFYFYNTQNNSVTPRLDHIIRGKHYRSIEHQYNRRGPGGSMAVVDHCSLFTP